MNKAIIKFSSQTRLYENALPSHIRFPTGIPSRLLPFCLDPLLKAQDHIIYISKIYIQLTFISHQTKTLQDYVKLINKGQFLKCHLHKQKMMFYVVHIELKYERFFTTITLKATILISECFSRLLRISTSIFTTDVNSSINIFK